MKASDLCVVCKRSSQTDTMGGDLPCQSYVYAADHDGKAYTCNLTGALITDGRGAIQCLANVKVHHTGYQIVSLADAIVQDRVAAAVATLSVAVRLTACLQGIKEDDYEGPRHPMDLAVRAAINDLHGKAPDSRPWTAEEILQREG
jgi:hypothetical protein